MNIATIRKDRDTMERDADNPAEVANYVRESLGDRRKYFIRLGNKVVVSEPVGLVGSADEAEVDLHFERAVVTPLLYDTIHAFLESDQASARLRIASRPYDGKDQRAEIEIRELRLQIEY